jgi:hypothetical protein
MSPLAICQAIQDSAIGTSIHESIWVFPIVESVHVLALSLSVGIIVMLDLRLIGAGMRHISVTQIVEGLKPWYLTGFALMFASGALLFWSEAAKCYLSGPFRFKMLFLLLAGLNAVLFEIRYKPTVNVWDGTGHTPAGAKVVGWCSLMFWVGVIALGRWTAYGMR